VTDAAKARVTGSGVGGQGFSHRGLRDRATEEFLDRSVERIGRPSTSSALVTAATTDDRPLTPWKAAREPTCPVFAMEEAGLERCELARMQGFIVLKGVRECPV